MVNIHISWWLDKKLSKSQCRFQQNKVCRDTLAIVTSDIIKAVKERNRVWEFLDIKSAHDNVQCDV
jgi:hypothetical protein